MARRLSLLMGLATFTLPFYHAAAYGYSAMFLWTNRYRPVTVPNYDQLGTVAFYSTFAIRQASAVGIPIFLFVAGFFVAFMAKNEEGGPSLRSAFKRIEKFLYPYALWTLITGILLQRVPSLAEALGLYYFIPLVAQYYVLSPLLVSWARNHGLLLLISAGVVQFGLHSLRYVDGVGLTFPGLQTMLYYSPIWFFPSRIFYFVTGIVIGLNLETFRQKFRERKVSLLIIATISLAMTFVEHESLANTFGRIWLGPDFSGVARNVYAVTFLVLLLAMDEIPFPFADQFVSLGRKALGVFLLNTPVVYVVSSLMYHLAPWTLGVQLVYQGVLVVFGLTVPLLAMGIVSRSPFRRYYRYVFG